MVQVSYRNSYGKVLSAGPSEQPELTLTPTPNPNPSPNPDPYHNTNPNHNPNLALAPAFTLILSFNPNLQS